MENVNLKINGLNVTAPAGSTILEAAQAAGIRIPTLCYLKEINEIGACRMCVVEVKGAEIWWQHVSTGVRGHGSADKYEETDGFQKKDAGTSSVQP